MKRFIFGLVALLGLFSCSDSTNDSKIGTNTSKRFTLIDSEESGVSFINKMVDSEEVSLTFEYRYNGAGVAVGDINNDGLDDLFFAASNLDNELYLNKGDLKFENISKKAGIHKREGVSTGVCMVDINCDGFLDIYVCRTGKFDVSKRTNLLYINNGDLTFTEKAAEYGLDDPSYSNQSSFFDYDNDGDLDMYLVNQPIEYTYANTILLFNDTGRVWVSDRMYENNGDSTFTDVTFKSGVDNKAFGFNASVVDFNNDQYMDLYVTNDYLQPDYLYINNQDGTYREALSDYMRHCPNSSMGSAAADYNNDGLTDIFVLDMMAEDNYRQKLLRGPMNYDDFYLSAKNGAYFQYMRNQLQLNNGNGTFSEIGELAGVSNTDWSWGPMLADFDNDGWKDLFIANGYRHDLTNMDYVTYYLDSLNKVGGIGVFKSMHEMFQSLPETPVKNYAFRNNADLTFENVSEEWGFAEKTFSNGAVYSDLDNDGDLDIVINNIDQPAMLYRNETSGQENNYLQVELHGTDCNTKGIGAEVIITQKELKQHVKYFPTQGFFSSVGNRIHFGLGNSDSIVSIEVRWPGGLHQVIDQVAKNEIVKVDVNDAVVYSPIEAPSPEPLFVNATRSSALNFVHQENDFIDFKREPLLPMEFSELGPSLAVGDVNGDGIEDVFIGGASGQAGAVFIQNRNGRFHRSSNAVFQTDFQYEDVGAVFFDCDNDNDLDLYVTSGGNEWDYNKPIYQDRLYINNGKGMFSRDMQAIPPIGFSTSCAEAADFDGDGDLDLFVGGRIISWNYPISPRSYLLVNNNGKFSDATLSLAPELKFPGMICNALWTDFNNDKKPDLILVGQWMRISLFENIDGRLQKRSGNGLSNSDGWWNCIAEGDFDNDGDIDYVVGNRGLNSRIKATQNEPARVYAGDFDGNRTMDALMTYYIQGKSYPIHGRDLLTDQIRPLKKKFLRYRDYANATMYDIFPKAVVDSSLILEAKIFASCYMQNNGDGTFTLKELPLQAQFSTVNAMIPFDWNNDGNLDILYAGNDYSPEVITGRYDASIGGLLIGRGDGTFEFEDNSNHGFLAAGYARNISLVKGGSYEYVVVVNNNDKAEVFKIMKPEN